MVTVIITAVIAFTVGVFAHYIYSQNLVSKDQSSYKDELEAGLASIKAYVKELTDKK